MEYTSHSPSYLVRNAHSYCFRLVVPKHLQVFVGRTELRYSLGTGRIGVAKQKSRFLAGQIQIIFKVLRKGFSWMGKLSENQIQQLVGVYIKKSIEELDKVFEGGEDTYRPFDDPPSLFNYLKELDIIKEDLMINLNLGDFSMLENSIDAFLKANGIDEVDKSSSEYRRLCIEVHKAQTKLIPIQQQHMQCDFTYRDQLPKLFPEVYPAKNDPPPPTGDQPPKQGKENVANLEKVFKEYWDEKEPILKSRSKPEFRRSLDHFIAFAGKATNIEEVDADVLRRYKQKLMKEESRHGKTRSINTINNKYLTVVKGFLNYAKHHGYITENPADGLIIPERDGKRRDEKREAFTIEDLRKMFCDSPEFGHDEIEQPYQFWMPLIGLHTGMRIEEICQLYVSDLKQFDGIWCLDINQDEEDKSVKTSERRIVPLHPLLTEDLNFVGYVQSLSDQQGRIFPELKRIKNRYSHYSSRWFSKFVKGCGIVADLNTKVFHSFRHTVTDHLFKKDAPERVISMLVGHAIKGETGGRYGKRYEPKLLYEKTVMRLDYGIDLSHLKKSKFVVK